MTQKFFRKVLKNGMTVILEKRDLPIVSVAFGVRQGGINEDLKEKGISHFIEHMLYKGTEKRTHEQIAEEIERKGGVLNGFTSEEVTAYWCKMPSEHLKIALDVLSDMVKNSVFDEKEFEKERQVIFEELKMRRDMPQMYALDKIQKLLYTGSLSVEIIGTYETMNSITREQIFEKFREVYQPNNMFLCVVGDADFDLLVDFCERNFSEKGGKILEQESGLKNEEIVEEREGVDQANLVFAYHVPTAVDDGSYVAYVLNSLMAGGMSARLFVEIREKRNLAYAVKGESNIGKRFAYNIVYVGTTKENVDVVKSLILEEFKKVAESLGEDELEKMKEQLRGNFDISSESSQERMVDLIKSEIDGDAGEVYLFKEKISSVSLEDVRKMAKKVADGDYSFFALVPKK